MIEKMKLVHIVTSASRKEEMLDGLREVGLMHLAEKQNADRNISEQFQTLSKTANALKEYADPKAKEKAPILSDEEFAGMYREVLDALEQKAALSQTIGAANTELDRISAWGDFSPQEVKELKEEGFDFHFYRLGAKELQDALNDENIRLIRLSSVDKMDTVAVIGTLPPTIPATEFVLPEKSVSELKEQIEACTKEIAVCDEKLRKASVYEDSFNDQMLKARNDMNYSAASATAQSDEDFVWLTGYIPEADLEPFKAKADAMNCAWAVEDVSEDDDQIPTKIRYNKCFPVVLPVLRAVLRHDYRRRRLRRADSSRNHRTHRKREEGHQRELPPLCIIHCNYYMGRGNRNLVRYGKCHEHTVLQENGYSQHSNLS